MSNFFGTVKTQGSVDYDAPVFEGHIEPTGDAIMAITTDSVLEGLQLQAALHVADATIEYTAVHESAQAAEAVLESVIGGTFGKIKSGLKALWGKIKAWFKQVAKSFQLMFTSGKDFIKKYKKEIQEKRAAGFEYDGYVWTVEAGNSKAASGMKAIDGVLKGLYADAPSVTMGTEKLEDKYDLSETKEKIVDGLGKALGVSGSNVDMSEIKKALHEAYRNGADEKTENKEFAKINRGDLIGLIEQVDKNKKFIDEAEKVVDKQFAESIKALDKLETAINKTPDSDFGKDGSAKRAKVTAYAAMIGNVTRYGQSLNSALAATAVESVKASAKEAESVLKSFIRFKGVKESFGSEDLEPGAENVFESLLQGVKL